MPGRAGSSWPAVCLTLANTNTVAYACISSVAVHFMKHKHLSADKHIIVLALFLLSGQLALLFLILHFIYFFHLFTFFEGRPQHNTVFSLYRLRIAYTFFYILAEPENTFLFFTFLCASISIVIAATPNRKKGEDSWCTS